MYDVPKIRHDSYHSEPKDGCPWCRIEELEAEVAKLREALAGKTVDKDGPVDRAGRPMRYTDGSDIPIEKRKP